MKQFAGYKETQSYKQRPQLPIGGYILEIKAVEAVDKTGKPSDDPTQLIFRFDIAEGPFKNFYMNDYKTQSQEDKKWKGNYRIWVPKEDGSEQDDWTKRKFKTVMETFEDCNDGYRWDWDEKKLKGLRIGGVFNQKEYSFNGRNGFFTQCKRFESIEAIENGTFKQPGTDYLDNGRNTAPADDSDDFMGVPDDIAERLPFA